MNFAKVMASIMVSLAATSAISALADNDRALIGDIAKDGMLEVKLGKLAEKRANNTEVKAFAKQMVMDHSKANDQLKVATKQDGIKLPADISDDQKEKEKSLSTLSGGDFDRKYIDAMVAGHAKAVEAVGKEATTGAGHCKDWAARTLPTIKHHKEEADKLGVKLKQ